MGAKSVLMLIAALLAASLSGSFQSAARADAPGESASRGSEWQGLAIPSAGDFDPETIERELAWAAGD